MAVISKTRLKHAVVDACPRAVDEFTVAVVIHSAVGSQSVRRAGGRRIRGALLISEPHSVTPIATSSATALRSRTIILASARSPLYALAILVGRADLSESNRSDGGEETCDAEDSKPVVHAVPF